MSEKRPFSDFRLSDLDLEKVEKVIKRGAEGRAVSRAIVLKMKDSRHSNVSAAYVAGVTANTVINICHYYADLGLERALYDDSMGRPKKAVGQGSHL